MALKQPRVPEYRESDGTSRYIHSLVLFLKDFCMDVWTANRQRESEIGAVKNGIHYPVNSVCGKTGDVKLTASDVGALKDDGSALHEFKQTTGTGDYWGLEQSVTAIIDTYKRIGIRFFGSHAERIARDAEGTYKGYRIYDAGNKPTALDLNIYPVGCIYMSVVSTSPASLFGGTWERLKDRFLLGAGDSYAAGSSGGAATVALSLAQMPQHGHAVYVWDNAGTTGNAYYYNGQTKTTHTGARLYNSSASEWIASGSTASAAGSGRGDPSGGTNLVGSGSAHNNMPPYLAVYMWKRVS
ncbi:MAG: phage baseplate protein [Candidatus Ventricola sp.]